MNKSVHTPNLMKQARKADASQDVADFMGRHADGLRPLLSGLTEPKGMVALNDLISLSGDPCRCPDRMAVAIRVLRDALLEITIDEIEQAGTASVFPDPVAAHNWNMARVNDLARSFEILDA